jgi:hypothetical protein
MASDLARVVFLSLALVAGGRYGVMVRLRRFAARELETLRFWRQEADAATP